ncbi:MAG TPA: sulfite exporter TauE/SafE family protein [Vicinamibacterales bacterium]|jgi:hypothetical protein|nr:sulfite exporter TauE/SafE family protein [Vicinamibacterales bacterium]
MPTLTPLQWTLALAGALGMGISKAGFPGMSLVHVIVFALVFGARNSTGIILPMLIAADVFAVRAFRQHARWIYIRRMLPATVVGIVAGFALMGRLDDRAFAPLIGVIVLVLTVLQAGRMTRPDLLADVPHSHAFAWTMGLLAGITTMVANAAGPIMTLYALSVSLPKFELVGTLAWFFFIVNLVKVPFSVWLGLIRTDTLTLNLVLVPVVFAGIAIGRWLTHRVPQRLFDSLLLAFAFVAALRLVGAW